MRKPLRHLRSLATIGLLTLVTSAIAPVAAAPAAQAATKCTSEYLCMYIWGLYTTDSVGLLQGSNADLRAFPHKGCPGGTWSACMQSVKNAAASNCFVLYDHYGYDGNFLVLGPKSGVPDLQPYGLYKQIRSVKRVPTDRNGRCVY